VKGLPIRVTFITTGLIAGGAEQMLLKLISSFDRTFIVPSVVSLTDEGAIGPRIRELGVPLRAMHLGRGRDAIVGMAALRAAVRERTPDIVQGWMYHGNVAAWTTHVITSRRWKLLWSVRQSLYDLKNEKRGTAAVIRAGAFMSRRGPRRIIYNSRVAARQHEALGYDARKSVVIPNGFDTRIFRPDPDRGRQLRASLGIPQDAMAVGLFARYHPMKNHQNFLNGVKRLLDQGRRLHCVLAGEGTASSPALAEAIEARSLGSHVTSLGVRSDMADLTRMLDVACLSSSWGEGFPNVIGEAMASGVPCVVTDIGDSAYLVGDTGVVVAPDNAVELCDAIAALDDMGRDGRAALGSAARNRIVESFSLEAITRSYEAQFEEVIANRPLPVV
jgi:glycosyltransferase involved in cell wall biosynthesis